MLNKKMIQLLLIAVCVGLSSAQDLDRSTWFPFSLPWNDTSVTVTSMLEAANVPAGKNGFLTVGADGHFHYAGKTDVVRFSGVVITAGANMPAKADAPAIAGRMAKYGINLVRVHLIDIPGDLGLLDYDANNTPVFNAVRLDRFDFFMKCLKDKGIHILMPLWGGREFNPGNGVPAGGGHHTPVLYDPVLIGLEKAYAKALFTHVNPYTGAAYKDDPFVALTEMVNETSLFRGWIGATDNTIFSNAEGGQLNPFYARELDSLFNEFLQVKYGNDAALAAAWSQGGQGLQGGEVMSTGTVKRTKRGDINSFSDARIADNAEFYYSVESKFITSMKSFLRDSVGVKMPITFTNQYFGLTSLASQSQADFMDTHRYWDYPNGNNKAGAFTIQNTSMLKSPTWSVIPYITLSHVEGKPLVVSEYNHPFPNAYQEEAPAFLYGYLGLMGADAVIWHCYKDFTPNYDSAAAVPFYEMRANPTILTQMLLSRAYLKGYLQSPAPTTVQYTDADLFKSAKRGEDKTQFNTPTISPAAAGLANPIVQKFHATSTAPAQLSDPGQYIQSSTKEVIWDGGKGLLSFNSPKWQGATGFLQDGIKLSSFTIGKVTTSNGRNFAAVHLMSLDGLPLSTSTRRILIAAARFENKGMVWNAGQTTVTNFGMDSAICEPVRAQVGIKMVHAESLVVYALDVFGSRTTPVAVEIKADTAYFNLAANTLWYEVSSKNAPPFAGIRRDGNGLARDAGELIFSTIKNGFQVHVPEGLNHSQYRIQLQLTDIRGKIVYEKPWTQLGGARDGMLTVQLGDRAGVRGAARELLVLSAKIADSEGRVVKAKSGRVVGL